MLGFTSKKEKQRKLIAKSHIRALWNILRADGRTHANELKMLHERASEYKLSQKEVNKIISEGEIIGADMEDTTYHKPETDEERFHFIYDLTYMMMVDDDIDYREKETCKDYAIQLGFQRQLVDDLVAGISDNIGSGKEIAEVYQKVYHILKKQHSY